VDPKCQEAHTYYSPFPALALSTTPATIRSVRRFLAIAALSVAVAGCGDSATYSRDEVVDAFERHGFTLIVRERPDETAAAAEGDLLTPHGGGQPFIVIVASDAAADEAWSDYESQQTRDSFDVRRANVVVISDSGLGAGQRERVLASMSSLPDRGMAVVVAGDG